MIDFVALARRHPYAQLVFSGGDPDLFPMGSTEADVVGRTSGWGSIVPHHLRKGEPQYPENATLSRSLVQPTRDNIGRWSRQRPTCRRAVGRLPRADGLVISVSGRSSHEAADHRNVSGPCR